MIPKTRSIGTQTDASMIHEPPFTATIKSDREKIHVQLTYDADKVRPHFVEFTADVLISLFAKLKSRIFG